VKLGDYVEPRPGLPRGDRPADTQSVPDPVVALKGNNEFPLFEAFRADPDVRPRQWRRIGGMEDAWHSYRGGTHVAYLCAGKDYEAG